MNRFPASVAAALFLLAGCLPSENRDAPRASAMPSPEPATIVKVKLSKSDGPEIPVVVRIPSAVGEVVFLHQKHIADRGMQCVDCHHQINAKKLETPHPDYLSSSWINCKTCHSASAAATQAVYTCSACHRNTPTSIADETLSAKVVVHKQCWKCHPVSTAKDASASCELCHSGKKAL